MNKLWFDEFLSDAVDDPRLHEELVPSMDVEIEKKERYRLNGNIVKGLEKLEHNVIVGNDAAFAVVQAVYRKPGKGIYAKSDPRNMGFLREYPQPQVAGQRLLFGATFWRFSGN